MIRLTFETCKNGCYETGIKEFTDEEYQKLLNDKGEVIMSVPAYNRELSTMEYISKAQELLNLTVELCLKMSKKYTYFGRAKTYEYAREIMDSLLIANSLNVKTDYEQRTKYLKRALGLLTCLSNHLITIMPYIKFQKTIIDKNGEKQIVENGEKKQKKLTRIAILISDCEKLTKGVIKKDKERLGVWLYISGATTTVGCVRLTFLILTISAIGIAMAMSTTITRPTLIIARSDFTKQNCRTK